MKPMEQVMNQSKPVDANPRIQEICDSLHRLESLISVTYAVPPENPADGRNGFVFFGSALYGDKTGL